MQLVANGVLALAILIAGIVFVAPAATIFGAVISLA
jgi:hypothetical protein